MAYLPKRTRTASFAVPAAILLPSTPYALHSHQTQSFKTNVIHTPYSTHARTRLICKYNQRSFLAWPCPNWIGLFLPGVAAFQKCAVHTYDRRDWAMHRKRAAVRRATMMENLQRTQYFSQNRRFVPLLSSAFATMIFLRGSARNGRWYIFGLCHSAKERRNQWDEHACVLCCAAITLRIDAITVFLWFIRGFLEFIVIFTFCMGWAHRRRRPNIMCALTNSCCVRCWCLLLKNTI